MLQDVFAGTLAVALAHMLEDSSEKCRELSCELFSQAIAVMPRPDVLLPVLVPVLSQRLGSVAGQEPSEEVRLRLVRLLAALTSSSHNTLEDHLPSMTRLLCAALDDRFPDIKKVLACFSGTSSMKSSTKRCASWKCCYPLVCLLLSEPSCWHKA